MLNTKDRFARSTAGRVWHVRLSQLPTRVKHTHGATSVNLEALIIMPRGALGDPLQLTSTGCVQSHGRITRNEVTSLIPLNRIPFRFVRQP